MHSLFNDKPGLAGFVKVGIILFIGLSLVNLYYSIKVNRKMNEKLNGAT
jgi:hypothetical protein